MLFAQFAGLTSLREIEEALSARPPSLYHLGLRPPKRSTLSDTSAARPAAVFRNLAGYLADRLGRALRREGEALIEILDSSPIRLDSLARGRTGESRFSWAEADARTFGLKLTCFMRRANSSRSASISPRPRPPTSPSAAPCRSRRA